MNLERYNYDLPPELIASAPAEPRDSARLFVYDTKSGAITLDVFKNLAAYLPKSVLVLNNTKVLPARVMLEKKSGGNVEVLFLLNETSEEGTVRAMVDRKVVVGDSLQFDAAHRLEAVGQDKHIFVFRYSFPRAELISLLYTYGTTPLPKYIPSEGVGETELRERYQSIFASHEGSVAAPTASLHFTNDVFSALDMKGVSRVFLTLDVGLGTFAPISDEHFHKKQLHAERYEITADAARMVADAKQSGIPVGAVGTTALRTLESAADAIGARQAVVGETSLFIFPPYKFKIAEYLITNFHLPKSSLMCLVEAFLQHKKARHSLVELYERAMAEKYRFYSFGDAMLIL